MCIYRERIVHIRIKPGTAVPELVDPSRAHLQDLLPDLHGNTPTSPSALKYGTRQQVTFWGTQSGDQDDRDRCGNGVFSYRASPSFLVKEIRNNHTRKSQWTWAMGLHEPSIASIGRLYPTCTHTSSDMQTGPPSGLLKNIEDDNSLFQTDQPAGFSLPHESAYPGGASSNKLVATRSDFFAKAHD